MRALPALSLEYFGETAFGNTALLGVVGATEGLAAVVAAGFAGSAGSAAGLVAAAGAAAGVADADDQSDNVRCDPVSSFGTALLHRQRLSR